ncbi:amidohydrolase [Woeseia oceani]|uniref:amidohydrolase n=1 Tax=Woeseia oceani TaxID=1548547 RepID=UPI0009F61B96|nr:amidohydrolase [Woeseia oceani]
MTQFLSVARIASFLFLSSWLLACGTDEPASTTPGADAVYKNGRIYTVDGQRSWAEALAISDGKIVYVGSNDGVTAHTGSNTVVTDLRGRFVLPGLQDSHVHPIGGGIEASACNLNDQPGLAEYRTIIGEYAAANPDVPWILGGGWAMSVFGPGGSPNRDILDELVPDRPVFLSSQDGHTGWANSVALEMAGIDKNTPDPVDGRIDRDPLTGEASGGLQEGAMKLVTRLIPATTDEDRLAGLRYALAMLNEYGITGIQDANVDADSLDAYKELERRGELSLHVVGSIWWDRERDMGQIADIIALRDKYTGGLIDAGTVKIMQDGVMENYTAAMLEPYLVPDGTRGIPMIEPELLKRVVSRLDAEGFQVHFHAIGDAAVRQSLDAVEEGLIDNGRLGHRHHISHLQMIDPQDIPRFKELDVVANFQPLWAYADLYVTELTIPFIGEERARWMYPIKSVQDAGGMIAFGSDWSVSTANPYHQMETAITRKGAVDDDMESMIPEERIDLETAIAAFTINAAFVNRNETNTGSLEVGKSADLVVLDRNLFEIEPQAISETKALLTLFQGRPVFGDPAAL